MKCEFSYYNKTQFHNSRTDPSLDNQYTSIGNTTYTYDNNGNLTKDNTNTYTYDSENRLISAVSPQSSAISYKYDPFGRRITKTIDGATTSFLYDGDQVICEYEAGAISAKYVYGSGIDEVVTMKRGGATYYYYYDGLGSVTALSDTNGDLAESYKYDIFGRATFKDAAGSIISNSQIGNAYLFTGRRFDFETGLYYYRSRYYSLAIGRFLQTDPAGYTAGINLYAYVSNNPLNWIDPLGLDKKYPWWESRGVIFGLSILDIGGATLETTFGAALATGGAGTEVATLGASSPISIPAMVTGSTIFYLGVVGIYEGGQHMKGAITNNRNLMEYDYFEATLGEKGETVAWAKNTADALKATAIFRRPASTLTKKGIPKLIKLMRYVNKYSKELDKYTFKKNSQ